MRTVVLLKTLILVSMVNASAQSKPTGFIAVSFSIDGTPAHCDGLQVELRLNGESIKPKLTGQRFEILRFKMRLRVLPASGRTTSASISA